MPGLSTYTPSGARRHTVHLTRPGTPVSDSDGSYTTAPVALVPATALAAILPATVAEMERVAAGTLVASASHLIRLPYHPQITTQTTVTFNGRFFEVVGVRNLEERNVELVLICVERVP